jgi:hypothetical protein
MVEMMVVDVDVDVDGVRRGAVIKC